MRSTLLLFTLALFGCSGSGVTTNPDPVDVSGTVKIGGKSVPDAKLHLQPTGAGLPAVLPVNNGNFQGKVTPGKYTYYLSTADTATAAMIKQKYAEGSMDRQIEVATGKALDLTFE